REPPSVRHVPGSTSLAGCGGGNKRRYRCSRHLWHRPALAGDRAAADSRPRRFGYFPCDFRLSVRRPVDRPKTWPYIEFVVGERRTWDENGKRVLSVAASSIGSGARETGRSLDSFP